MLSQCCCFMVLKSLLIFFKECTKGNVSALEGEQSTTVRYTNWSKNGRKCLGKLKECSHRNMSSIGRWKLTFFFFFFLNSEQICCWNKLKLRIWAGAWRHTVCVDGQVGFEDKSWEFNTAERTRLVQAVKTIVCCHWICGWMGKSVCQEGKLLQFFKG